MVNLPERRKKGNAALLKGAKWYCTQRLHQLKAAPFQNRTRGPKTVWDWESWDGMRSTRPLSERDIWHLRCGIYCWKDYAAFYWACCVEGRFCSICFDIQANVGMISFIQVKADVGSTATDLYDDVHSLAYSIKLLCNNKNYIHFNEYWRGQKGYSF